MRDKVIKYLNEKYKEFDDSYKVVFIEPAGIRADKIRCIVNSKLLGKKRIIVDYINESWIDNYMILRMIFQYENWMQQIYDNNFGQCKCICSDNIYPSNKVSKDITLERFLNLSECYIKEYVILGTQSNASIDDLIKNVKEYKIPHCYIKIIPVGDDVFNAINDFHDLEVCNEKEKLESILIKFNGIQIIDIKEASL